MSPGKAYNSTQLNCCVLTRRNQLVMSPGHYINNSIDDLNCMFISFLTEQCCYTNARNKLDIVLSHINLFMSFDHITT